MNGAGHGYWCLLDHGQKIVKRGKQVIPGHARNTPGRRSPQSRCGMRLWEVVGLDCVPGSSGIFPAQGWRVRNVRLLFPGYNLDKY